MVETTKKIKKSFDTIFKGFFGEGYEEVSFDELSKKEQKIAKQVALSEEVCNEEEDLELLTFIIDYSDEKIDPNLAEKLGIHIVTKQDATKKQQSHVTYMFDEFRKDDDEIVNEIEDYYTMEEMGVTFDMNEINDDLIDNVIDMLAERNIYCFDSGKDAIKKYLTERLNEMQDEDYLNDIMYLCVGCNELFEAQYCLDTSKIKDFDYEDNYIKDNYIIGGRMICDDCYEDAEKEDKENNIKDKYDNYSSIHKLFEKL